MMSKYAHKKAMSYQLVLLCALAIVFSGIFANVAHACTTDENLFKPEYGEQAFESIRGVIDRIDLTLTDASERLYTGIIGDGAYQAAMAGVATLFFIVYGVAIMFGLVPVTLAQAAIRLFKFAFIFMLISDVGWEWTTEFVGGIFNDGTVEIINSVIAVAGQLTVGVGADCNPLLTVGLGGVTDITAPVEIFRCSISELLNPRVFVILFATFKTGVYGLPMGLALGWALYSLLMMLIRAFQVYALSMIVRALLIGMSPLFFAFLFFEKTKPIFMGWINQLINFSLQPIMLFAFLAFFMQIVTGAMQDIMPKGEVEVCYVKAGAPSGPTQTFEWKFVVEGEPFEGSWGLEGGETGELLSANGVPITDVFPLTPISILTFLVLTYIASEMATVVTQMAAEMSQGYVKLDENTGSDVIRNLAPKK